MDAHVKNWYRDLQQSAVESGRGFSRPSSDLSVEEQLRNFFDSLPQRLLERPWTMAEIADKLVGKYRDHPHTLNMWLRLSGVLDGFRKETGLRPEKEGDTGP